MEAPLNQASWEEESIPGQGACVCVHTRVPVGSDAGSCWGSFSPCCTGWGRLQAEKPQKLPL